VKVARRYLFASSGFNMKTMIRAQFPAKQGANPHELFEATRALTTRIDK
jgi:hypothetical protein